ncbi:MAG: sugar phosphate isomerase/epimerase [Desulfomonile tiedjei]|nr:sugar phosphate isomerase/epimerase [Desulfomonile tiedjei]
MLYGAMNFPIKPLLEELRTISELGFDYLELTMDPPQSHHATIRSLHKALLNELDRTGMKLVCHLPSFLYLADLTDSVREASLNEMLQSLEVAADLGALKVVAHPAYATGLGAMVADRVRRYRMKSLAAMVETADRLGLCLCLENMFPRANSLTEPEDFAEALAAFPTLKLTLDIAHANIGGRGSTRNLEFLRQYAGRIAHIHVSDNFGKEDNHLPIGGGSIDFPRIIKALKNIGYDGTMTLEVFSRDKDYLRISRDKIAAMVKGS